MPWLATAALKPNLRYLDQPARQPWKKNYQQKGTQQGGRQNILHCIQLGELGAGVHVNDGQRQHAELTDPVERPRWNPSHAHPHVDQKIRDHRHEPQPEQIEGAGYFHAGTDHPQPAAQTALHHITQSIAGGQESQSRTDGRGERHQHRTPDQSKNRPTRQAHDDHARQR